MEIINKVLIFLSISTIILILTAITISLAPIINDVSNLKSTFSQDLDCEVFSNPEKPSKSLLDETNRLKTFKNTCRRQKAMYNLEYDSLIINAVLAFICTNFALLSFFKEGEAQQNKAGLLGLIFGIISFILTLIYVCFSGYIFTKDPAKRYINMNNFLTNGPSNSGGIIQLFPNGAKYKYNGERYITPYEEKNEYDGQYVKYKDLGDKQYNYNKDYYIKYYKNEPNITFIVNECNIGNNYILNNNGIKIDNKCDYLFPLPYSDNSNRYLYERWLTTLVLSVFIFIFDLALAVFGLLLFLDKEPSKDFGNDLIV